MVGEDDDDVFGGGGRVGAEEDAVCSPVDGKRDIIVKGKGGIGVGRSGPCAANHPQPGRLQGAAGCSQGPLQRGDRPRPKPLAGVAPSSAGSARGQGCCLQGRPLLQEQRPCKVAPLASEVPPEGNSACHRGGCPRRWRAATLPAHGSDGGAVRVREEG
ncbi:hypothetical protein BHE74_00023969 [Ensete ventricosum]|nr:hypothetical protein BHE74_00023969 [Ensete ventricosum]